MNSLEKLEELFRKFPGIGPRQAKRFVYFLLTRNSSYIKELVALIEEIKKDTSVCTSCFRYFERRGKEATCSICSNPNRDSSLLMVVSRDVDLENMEKAGEFNGLYFIIGGSLPILEKEPEKRIRINELLKIVGKRKNDLKEIIIAMNTNTEGENTADYLQEKLAPLKESGIKISTLGRGLATGAELEYADPETLRSAFKNRS